MNAIPKPAIPFELEPPPSNYLSEQEFDIGPHAGYLSYDEEWAAYSAQNALGQRHNEELNLDSPCCPRVWNTPWGK